MILDYMALQEALAVVPQSCGQAPPGYAQNSVCLLLFDRAETFLLAIQKADSEGYHWRDQVALPGGRIDATDRDARAAALRELHEELGVDPAEVEVLGELGHFQTATSQNDLQVSVGRWRRPAAVHADGREVARVLEIPLRRLREGHLAQGFRSQPASALGDRLAYPFEEARIWGVTARILHRFLELVLDRQLAAG